MQTLSIPVAPGMPQTKPPVMARPEWQPAPPPPWMMSTESYHPPYPPYGGNPIMPGAPYPPPAPQFNNAPPPAVEPKKVTTEKPLTDEEKVGKIVASWLKQYPQWKTYIPPQMLDQFDNGTINPESVNQILSKFLAQTIKQHVGGGYMSRMGLKSIEKMAVASVPPPFNTIVSKAFDLVTSKAV